jgi:hypothetical protein
MRIALATAETLSMRKAGIIVILLTLTFANYAYGTNLVANSGFETFETYIGPWPTEYGVWKGDVSQVVGGENGITPIGNGMFKFVDTGWTIYHPNGQSGELVQFIDMSPYASLISSEQAKVQFAAHYNRIADTGLGTVDDAFSVRLFACSGSINTFRDNVFASLAFNESLLASDNDPSTWELTSASLRIPSGTTYLAIMLRATENRLNDFTDEFGGHYADNISVQFIPEPSTAMLLAVVVLGMVGLKR